MKIILINCATAKETWFEQANQVYSEKINHFFPFQVLSVKSKKNSRENALLKKQEDSQAILAQITSDDFVILFDELGQSFGSIEFSQKIQLALQSGKKRIVFIIGGAFGVTDELKKRAQLKVNLSKMTMNHIVAQTVALEQIYRALTILKGIPYHNEG